MPEIASDIVVTGAKVYYSPVGTSVPAATVAVGGTWTGWTSVGYTLEAVKLTYKFDTLDIMVQQTMNAVARFRIKEELNFETVLAEHTTDMLALALAGASAQTAATGSVPGYEELTIGGDGNLPIYQWGFEGSYVDEDAARFPIRVFIWKATSAEGGDLEYDREKPAGIPLQIKALADTSKATGAQLLKLQRVLEPAT